MTGQVNFLSQPELDALLKDITGEIKELPPEESIDVWAATMADVCCEKNEHQVSALDARAVGACRKMAEVSRFEFVDTPPPKPITKEQLIDKLQYEIDQADRDVVLILERRSATYNILQDVLRLAP